MLMTDTNAGANAKLREKALTLKKLCGNIEDVHCTFAEVAELADALRSGRSVHKTWGFKSPLRHQCCPERQRDMRKGRIEA